MKKYTINKKKKKLVVFDYPIIITHKIIHEISSINNDRYVVCKHCNSVYDLTKTKVIHRYNDCTHFITPCCNIDADDRLERILLGNYNHFKKLNEYLKK